MKNTAYFNPLSSLATFKPAKKKQTHEVYVVYVFFIELPIESL